MGSLNIVLCSAFTFALCFAGIGLLFYFPGYQRNINRNGDLHTTECDIMDHRITEKVCTEQCNCNADGVCQTCTYTCYDGEILLDYSIYYNEYSEWVIVVNNRESGVEEKLDENWPIGDTIECYYHPEEPNNILLTHYPTTVFLVFAVICWVVGVLGFVCLLFFSQD